MAEVRNNAETGAETVAAGVPSPVPPDGATTLPGEVAPPNMEKPSVAGFEIIEELGRGGMGVVYKARQVSLNRFVALKMILAGPYAGSDQLLRFRLEAEAVARLQHSGIVQIHEIGNHAGHSYLALEYVPGGTLTRRCAGRPLAAGEAAEVVEVLARSVHYAHQQGIVHRDLKPGNVLLTEAGEPKITDFGLAKRLEAEPGATPSGPQTQSGAILGTPAYMAPEQAAGKREAVGPAVDVYALGAILYELLTGRPPFQADNPVDILVKVMTEEPVPPRKREPALPRDLETVCLKCLQKDPGQRYPSADSLADDLGRFLNGEPTLARPQRPGERLRRWAWRRRWWLASGVTAALVLLLLSCSLLVNLSFLFWLAPTSHNSVSPERPPTAEVNNRLAPAVERIALPADLALVPPDAPLFLTVRAADLWQREDVKGLNKFLVQEKLADLADLGEQVVPIPVRDWERVTYVNFQMPLGQSFVTIVRPVQPFRREAVEAELERRGLKAQQVEGKSIFGSGPRGQTFVYVHDDRVLAWSNREESLRDWLRRLPAADASGALRPALELAAQERHHFVIGAAPPREVRDEMIQSLQELARSLPPEQEPKLADARPLSEVRTATLTADLKTAIPGGSSAGVDVDVRLGYADAAAAAKGHEALIGLRDFLAGLMKLHAGGSREGVPPSLAHAFSVTLGNGIVEQHGLEDRLGLKMAALPGWLPAAAAALKEEDDRVRSLNNLKQLGRGMWNYHDAHGNRFPPAAISDKSGKPLLSWRVAILPYINQGALYQQFKLDEPWNSEHNKKLLGQMPALFEPPLKPAGWQPNTTYYQVFVGEQTLFPPGKQLGIADVTDGTSNTLLIVEANEAVPWSKPADLPYDPTRPLPMLGGIFHNGFQVVMADGTSTRLLPKKIAPATLRALITPHGGEAIKPP